MPSFGALRETQCPRCGRAVDLPFGMLCGECRAQVRRRARRLARRWALGVVLAFGVWVLIKVPDEPMARIVAGSAALFTWALVYTIVYRAATLWLS